MKMKKLFSILLISASLMTVSQSVFADSPVNEVEVIPYVIGLGDTKTQAVDIYDGQELNLFLQSAEDEDWFKWTNNTGKGQFTYGFLNNLGPENTVALGIVIQYTPSRESELLIAEPTQKGNPNWSSKIRNVYVPDGATLYLRVKADEYVNLEQYMLSFGYYHLD
ncbi:hypothetical protein M2277_003447 [Paenibacillus sp. LBL]|uniref:hypothetical protein n=1 Tax=Paenibacillus sp. LBL TaxID=2940563 RepID=UPI002473D631|nr:hypothetical protein [Paenibacillus sp. LBL]MDH6672785.1 hypothetical protein [Paenibacillus sp. LBL]